ncbi:MAG TPA: glycosyltransferase, partial [bacterium]|nr:glycosyltransferase [bacterium]
MKINRIQKHSPAVETTGIPHSGSADAAWTPVPSLPPLTLLSVVIPARDESESLPATLEHLYLEFTLNRVPHEIVVVDDGSQDQTWEVLRQLKLKIPTLRPMQNS